MSHRHLKHLHKRIIHTHKKAVDSTVHHARKTFYRISKIGIGFVLFVLDFFFFASLAFGAMQ